jgi:ketosteroid isomerase-like protein
MLETNKTILEKANAAIAEGNIESFLSFCAEDIDWTMVGDTSLKGKEAVRQWMATVYAEPPQFTVTHWITEGDFLVVQGEIDLKEEGKLVHYSYCDVWRFQEGKMVALKAYAVKTEI